MRGEMEVMVKGVLAYLQAERVGCDRHMRATIGRPWRVQAQIREGFARCSRCTHASPESVVTSSLSVDLAA